MENYQFIKVPLHLFYLMDANTSKVLITLVQMSDFYGKDGWFYRSMNNLEDATGLSQNVIRAALDALYQEGLVNVDTVGISKGKHPNRYKVNTEKFQDYEKYSLDDIISGGVAKIETTKYKTGHFTPSYMRQQQGQSTGQQTGQKVSTNIDNIDNIENINNKITKEQITEVIDIPIIEKENLKEKESEMPNNWTRDTNRPGLGQVYLDDDLIRSLTDNERSIQLEYYYIIRDLRKLELNKNKESCFSSQTIDWIGDHNIYHLRECMRNWNEGGRTELAKLIECLTPALRKEIMIYLVLNCKAADTSENNRVYQQVYAA